MIRVLKEITFDLDMKYVAVAGLSTDTKPVDGIITGSKFLEVDTGYSYEFDEVGKEWYQVLGADIEGAVEKWLDDHPEATTTVEDGSITEVKLASALADKVNNPVTLSLVSDNLYAMNL